MFSNFSTSMMSNISQLSQNVTLNKKRSLCDLSVGSMACLTEESSSNRIPAAIKASGLLLSSYLDIPDYSTEETPIQLRCVTLRRGSE